MEIKTTKCIWNDVTISEPQCDEWGRSNRGTPLVYYNRNHKYHCKKWVAVDDELIGLLEDMCTDYNLLANKTGNGSAWSKRGEDLNTFLRKLKGE